MTYYTVAIGDNYILEAERLKKSLPSISIFTDKHPKYKVLGQSQLSDGLYHKSNFANYIDKAEGPVFFMDADLYSEIKKPMDSFKKPSKDVDIAFVPYKGKWYFPDEERKQAENKLGCKINSGFIYFKDLETAKKICTEWLEVLKRRLPLNVHEYDEYSLMIALVNGNYKWEFLDEIWNDWGENTLGEPMLENSIFKQKHIK